MEELPSGLIYTLEGMCPAEVTPRLHEELESGVRRMMPLAALSGVRYVVMPADWPQPINFNTLEDWQTLENSDALHPS